MVLIDMEMPSWCGECRFCVDNWCYCVPPEKRQPAVSISGKTCWCPLVEVPEPKRVMSKDEMEDAGFET